MQDFNYLDSDYNFSGLEVIEFLPTSFVDEIPDAEDLLVEGEIVLDGINRFYRMYATLETSRMHYNQVSTEHGMMYDVVVNAFIPKLKIENDFNFEQLKEKQLILICNDNNGKRRIVGNILSGATILIDADSAANFAARNGTAVQFIWQSAHIPYYYDIPLEAEAEEVVIDEE